MKKITSLLTVCVLLFSLTACFSEQPSLVGSGDNSSTEPAGDKTFKVGDTVELDDIVVSFVGVTEHTGSEFLKPADGKIFVLCEFEISNNSNSDLAVSSILNFEAYYDNYACELSISALAEKGDKEQLDGSVSAGKKMKGVVGYEIPADWKELEVHYTPDLLSSEKIVFVAANN